MGLVEMFIPENISSTHESFLFVILEALAILLLTCLLRIRIRKKYDHEFNFGFKCTFDFRLFFFLMISFAAYFIAYRSSLGLVMDKLPQSELITRILDSKTRNFENNPLPMLLSMVLLAPLFEEVVVRGVILRGFLNRYSPVYAIWLSGILFGISHGYPPQIINAIFLGIMLGYIYFYTRSIVICILLHSFLNGLAIHLYSVQFEFNLLSFTWSFLLFIITLWYFFKHKIPSDGKLMKIP